MKIILSAFNEKLMSAPMEVPEGTGVEFRLPMNMDTFSGVMSTKDETPPQLETKIGNFMHTGKYVHLEDMGYELAKGEERTAALYALVSIN